jgi:hypothetical protein
MLQSSTQHIISFLLKNNKKSVSMVCVCSKRSRNMDMSVLTITMGILYVLMSTYLWFLRHSHSIAYAGFKLIILLRRSRSPPSARVTGVLYHTRPTFSDFSKIKCIFVLEMRKINRRNQKMIILLGI